MKKEEKERKGKEVEDVNARDEEEDSDEDARSQDSHEDDAVDEVLAQMGEDPQSEDGQEEEEIEDREEELEDREEELEDREEERIVPTRDSSDQDRPRRTGRRKKRTDFYGDVVSHSIAAKEREWLFKQAERAITLAEEMASKPEVTLQLKALDYLNHWMDTFVPKMLDCM